MEETVVDAVDALLAELESRSDVAYAEVGGVDARTTNAVVTEAGVRSANELPTRGVWCRVFVGGAAGYRYETALDEESLSDAADRVVRAAGNQKHDRDARVDARSVHRSVHDGWAREPLSARSHEDVVAAAERDVAEATAGRSLDRVRVELTAERRETTVATSSGSVVRTDLDRVAVEPTFARDGVTVRRHAGATTGGALLDRVPALLEDALAALDRLAAAGEAAGADDVGDGPVTLAPAATGRLFAHLAGHLEADARYGGRSAVEVGDRLGPGSLSVRDGVEAGSWAALAYDAEARPTTPTTLVEDGEVRSLLHSTATAADPDGPDPNGRPAGNLVPGLSAESAPRIAARHLDVAAGDAEAAELRSEATAVVERLGEPWVPNPMLRKAATGWAPPSALSADAAREVLEEEVPPEARRRVEFPVEEGFLLADGERVARLDGARLAFDLEDLHTVSRVGARRETTTGVRTKAKTRLPFAATAPALTLETTLR